MGASKSKTVYQALDEEDPDNDLERTKPLGKLSLLMKRVRRAYFALRLWDTGLARFHCGIILVVHFLRFKISITESGEKISPPISPAEIEKGATDTTLIDRFYRWNAGKLLTTLHVY